MKISVVIPTYNRDYCIERAVDSVLNQSYSPFEIIIVDDGSRDRTNEILGKYSDKIQIISQRKKGVSSARNAGIAKAQGDWIALLDSDDEWLPNKLIDHTAFNKINPHLKIFQCEEIWIRNGVRVNPKKKHQKYGGWIFKECLPLCIVSPSAVIFDKSLWHSVGGFDEKFTVCEDYDLWLRISRQYEIGLDKNPGIIKYGGHSDQLSRTRKMDAYRVMALEKLIYDPALEDNLKVLVLNEAIKKLNILEAGAKKRNKNGNIWLGKRVTFEKMLSKIQ